MVGGATTASGCGSSSPAEPSHDSHPFETPTDDPIFNHRQCLFCDKFSSTFDSNVAHMQTAHGLFVPNKRHLVVDLEVLFSYLHLVISVYNGCICCGTQRNNAFAIQQHMLDKGHCRFDIDTDDSEYADFYDFSGTETETESGGEDDDSDDDSDDMPTPMPPRSKMVQKNQTVQVDENSLRLPSGRIVSSRSQTQIDPRRHPLTSRSSGHQRPLDRGSNRPLDPRGPAPSTALSTTPQDKAGLAPTKAEKQETKFQKRLATLSANDEKSLAHLSLPEQRAVLATQQKQVEKAQRDERRYRSRVEGLGNMTLMTHFVKDAADKRTQWK